MTDDVYDLVTFLCSFSLIIPPVYSDCVLVALNWYISRLKLRLLSLLIPVICVFTTRGQCTLRSHLELPRRGAATPSPLRRLKSVSSERGEESRACVSVVLCDILSRSQIVWALGFFDSCVQAAGAGTESDRGESEERDDGGGSASVWGQSEEVRHVFIHVSVCLCRSHTHTHITAVLNVFVLQRWFWSVQRQPERLQHRDGDRGGVGSSESEPKPASDNTKGEQQRAIN